MGAQGGGPGVPGTGAVRRKNPEVSRRHGPDGLSRAAVRERSRDERRGNSGQYLDVEHLVDAGDELEEGDDLARPQIDNREAALQAFRLGGDRHSSSDDVSRTFDRPTNASEPWMARPRV